MQEEIRSLEFVKELDKIETLVDRLPSVIGSPLSLNNLREDLEVSFASVKHWIAILEKIYSCFRIPPYGPPKLKAVKKEQKLYLWNWSNIEEVGARHENIVAFHLLRMTHWCEDILGEKIELRYFKTVMGHEVEFVLLKKGKPWLAIDVKTQEQDLSPSMKYFLERVKIPFAFQIHFQGKKDYEIPAIDGCKVRIMPAEFFLSNLP